jgi:hypothetical protein
VESQRERETANFENTLDGENLPNIAQLYFSTKVYRHASTDQKRAMQARAIELLKQEGAQILPGLRNARYVYVYILSM